MAARGLLLKTLFPPSLVSCLRYQVFFSFEDNHPSGNFKVTHPFKALCRNVKENCDVYVAIDRVGYLFKKKKQKKTTFQVFFVLCT